MRAALARVEQNLALVAQTQRDADRQLQTLEQRRERLQQELRELHTPDPERLEQLAGDRLAGEDQLEAAQAELATLEGRVPEADAERSRAQAAAQQDAQGLARLEARLAALVKLQEDVQKQGALEPWLAKHELAGLGRLWQKLHIEPGWETALEAALRERMAALEVRSLDWARAFADDAPPARLAFYQVPAAAPAPAAPQGQTPLASLLRVTDPDLRTLLNQWLAGLYTAADLTQALAGRASLPAGAAYVVKAGHLVDAHSVRFYAPDSEQAGLLARQQEIENLQREIKAQQLIADQARAAVARAEAAWQQVSQAIAPARQRVAEVTRRVHDIQLEHSRLQQQAEQSGERAARLRQDLEELAAHEEDLRATREEAEVRFEALDGELAEHQSRFSDAEIDGETLSAQADAARTRLRELERAAQEAEFAERGVQVRITDLQRNRQLAADQSQRAGTELQQLETDLVDLDASASQAGLQDALELRAEREEALTRARLELDNLSALMRGADEERMQQERGLERCAPASPNCNCRSRPPAWPRNSSPSSSTPARSTARRWPASWPRCPTSGARPVGCSPRWAAFRARSTRWGRSTWPPWTN